MLTYILLAVFYLLFILISWPKLIRGIYFITLFLPSYLIRFEIFSVPFTLLEGMVIILFLLWLIKLYKNKKLNSTFIEWLRSKLEPESEQIKKSSTNLIPPVLRLPIFAFIFSATLAMIFSPSFLAAAGVWKAYFIEPIMFLLVFIYTVKSSSQLNKVVNCLAALTIIVFIFALIQKVTGWYIPNLEWYLPDSRRITTFFGYPNANGLLVAPLAMLFMSSLWMQENIYSKLLKIIALIGSILTVIWAGTEGAIIAMAVGTLFIFIIKKQTRFLGAFLIGLGIVSLFIFPAFRNYTWDKLTFADQSGQIRQAQWSETLALLKDKPFLGGGLANYQIGIEPYHRAGLSINGKWQPVEIYLYPHNFILNFWTEIGILGLASTIWLFIALAIMIYKTTQPKKTLPKYKQNFITNISLGVTASMVGIFIHGLVDVPYFKNDLSILFWILIGMVIIIYNQVFNKKLSELE